MQAVWMVRSRQIVRKLVWWLVIIGYDRNDHSLAHRIYLVYASVFFSFWFFAVFSLFAGPATTILKSLGVTPVNEAAALLSTLALLGWGSYRLWQATRRSPLVFSENDAHLICQAPVPGRPVALAWFLGDWFEPAAPFWAGAVTLSIAWMDHRLENNVSLTDLPAYITAALQALMMIGLVQLGLMALVWAAGALRLQRDRQLTWQPGTARLGILAVGSILAFLLVTQGPDGLSRPFWQAALGPFLLPARAAFGAAPLAIGLLVGLAWLILGPAALAWAGTNLNLSRAAQETTQKEKVETAQRYGQSELARQVTLSNRLGGGHAPSRLPVRPGDRIMSWKDVLQSGRAFSLSDAWRWLGLAAVTMGVWLVPDPGARLLALAIWSVMAGQRITGRLQKDLANWSLLRLLPFSSRRLVEAELWLPWTLVVLLGWVTLALTTGAWPVSVRLSAALLLPYVSRLLAFTAAFDLLRQAQADMLLNGNPPQLSATGGLLGILCLALPLGLWYWLNQLGLVGALLAAILAVLLARIFRHLAGRRMQLIT